MPREIQVKIRKGYHGFNYNVPSEGDKYIPIEYFDTWAEENNVPQTVRDHIANGYNGEFYTMSVEWWQGRYALDCGQDY